MTSILSGFDTVQQALAAQQFALSVTQKNIANVNNPNYTRQEVLFTQSAGELDWGIPGVAVRASRDRFLDCSICRELQSLSENTVAYEALQQVDAVMGSAGGDNLRQALSNFFNSFQSLSTAPENMALRMQVLSTANALAMEFRRAYEGIQQVQSSADQSIRYAVDDINTITGQIAELNRQITSAQQSKSESLFELRDRRQQLLENLSSLIGISFFETESGSITVTTSRGEPLVTGSTPNAITTAYSTETPFLRLQLEGIDISDSIESGKIGGWLRLRDNVLPGYLAALDEMAATIMSRVNQQHARGTDLDGLPGEDLFVPWHEGYPGSNTGAARSMKVAITDTRKIAAAAVGYGVGDNSNARLLAQIGQEKLFNGSTQTVYDYFAGLIYRIGVDEKTASDTVETQTDLVTQLRNQRAAMSGVSLDEEAVNIIKYQKAYQASARMANVLDELSAEILNLLGT